MSDPESVPVCLLQEKTDRLASGNMEYVVCGCSSGVVSSEYCMALMGGFSVTCLCVCVCSQHEEKEKALKEQLSHLTALLPTLQVEYNNDDLMQINSYNQQQNHCC